MFSFILDLGDTSFASLNSFFFSVLPHALNMSKAVAAIVLNKTGLTEASEEKKVLYNVFEGCSFVGMGSVDFAGPTIIESIS